MSHLATVPSSTSISTGKNVFKDTDAGSKRKAEIRRRFLAGETMQEIGTSFGVTRERIRQILSGEGISGKNGGYKLKSALNRKSIIDQKREQREHRRRIFDRWVRQELGVSLATACQINGTPFKNKRELWTSDGACKKYLAVKRQAERKHPGLPYIGFMDWLHTWSQSGHGTGGPYPGWCMLRTNDNQPWSLENVRVVRVGCWMHLRKTDARKKERKPSASISATTQ